MKKTSGAYYTPELLANWLVSYSDILDNSKVLEPGCGEGSFLKALDFISEKELDIDAVELDSEAIKLAKLHKYKNTITFVNKDFLFWKTKRSYDLIIGNPPYVVKKRLTKDQSDQCRKIHVDNGLENKEVANLWTAFLVKSVSLLATNGILAFVLPNEILQVKYAEEIRSLLQKKFERIEVVSSKKLAFSGIEQDTVVVICYSNTSKEKGSYFTEVQSIKELKKSLMFQPVLSPKLVKWTANILSKDELETLQEISSKLKKTNEICQSGAGIVTAANNYFIVNSSTLFKFDLEPYAKFIIQKGMHVNGSMDFSSIQYNGPLENDTPCWLIDLNGVPEDKFNKGLIQYLELGVLRSIDQRYKCLQRKRWFDVPSIWKSEGFFFKRSYQYPKLLINSAEVYVTDSAYRISMLDDY